MAKKNRQHRADQPKFNQQAYTLHKQGPKIENGVGKRPKSTKND